jgi:hypothetical protein
MHGLWIHGGQVWRKPEFVSLSGQNMKLKANWIGAMWCGLQVSVTIYTRPEGVLLHANGHAEGATHRLDL